MQKRKENIKQKQSKTKGNSEKKPANDKKLTIKLKAKKQEKFATKNVLFSPYNYESKPLKYEPLKLILNLLTKYIESKDLKTLIKEGKIVIGLKRVYKILEKSRTDPTQ